MTEVATTTQPTSRSAWFRGFSQEVLMPTAVLLGLVGIWEASVHLFSIPVYLLPAPSQIWVECSAMSGVILKHTLATLHTVLIGFLVSILISIPLAVVLTLSRGIATAVYPVLVITQAIPKVALAPLLVIILGANELPRVVITFLVAFFPLVIASATGLMSVPHELIELGRSYKISLWQELCRIRLPYAVPMIFSGLKVAITLSVVGAVVGEFVNADRGLGFLIVSASAFFQVPVAFGALVLLSLMGVVLFQIIVVIERIFFPWSAESAGNSFM